MVLEIETGRMRITERDKECVRFVVEQGFATIEQLWKVAWSNQKNSSYTYNRVLSLEKFGFLKSVKINSAQFRYYLRCSYYLFLNPNQYLLEQLIFFSYDLSKKRRVLWEK